MYGLPRCVQSTQSETLQAVDVVVRACSFRLRLACKAFWTGLDSTSAYWAEVSIELPAGVNQDRRPSLQYVKQGLGSSARSVGIAIKQDWAC